MRRGGLRRILLNCRSFCVRLNSGILYASGVGAMAHRDATDPTCDILCGGDRACSHWLHSHAETSKKATIGSLAASGAGRTSTPVSYYPANCLTSVSRRGRKSNWHRISRSAACCCRAWRGAHSAAMERAQPTSYCLRFCACVGGIDLTAIININRANIFGRKR